MILLTEVEGEREQTQGLGWGEVCVKLKDAEARTQGLRFV